MVPYLRRRAVTLVEIMLGFLVLALIFLPIFNRLTSAVRDTERFYTECFAISHAKLVMDTLMSQVPLRCLHEGNPCVLRDPKGVPAINALLGRVIPEMMKSEYESASGAADEYLGNGSLTDGKGFRYRVRVSCIDLENVTFTAGGQTYTAKELSEKDADGKWVLMKKILVEVRWSLRKGLDPLNDPQSRRLHLVAIKSDLER